MDLSGQIILPKDYPEGEAYRETRELFSENVQRWVVHNKVPARVYNSKLFVLLWKQIELKNPSGDKVTKNEVLEAYVQGFQEGKAKFNELYSIEPNTLFLNPVPYVQNLHEACFHLDPITGKERNPWVRMAGSYPGGIIPLTTFKGIKDLGFYAGLYYCVEEKRKQYPAQFATFDECHLAAPQAKLTYLQKAVQLRYLFDYGAIERPTKTQLTQMNNGNVQLYNKGWNPLIKGEKEPNKDDLEKVFDSLFEYPEIQKAVTNDLYKLKSK